MRRAIRMIASSLFHRLGTKGAVDFSATVREDQTLAGSDAGLDRPAQTINHFLCSVRRGRAGDGSKLQPLNSAITSKLRQGPFYTPIYHQPNRSSSSMRMIFEGGPSTHIQTTRLIWPSIAPRAKLGMKRPLNSGNIWGSARI